MLDAVNGRRTFSLMHLCDNQKRFNWNTLALTEGLLEHQ